MFVNPSRPDPGRREKIDLNFHFHTSLRCLNRFYRSLKGSGKTFLFECKFLKCTGRKGLNITFGIILVLLLAKIITEDIDTRLIFIKNFLNKLNINVQWLATNIKR